MANWEKEVWGQDVYGYQLQRKRRIFKRAAVVLGLGVSLVAGAVALYGGWNFLKHTNSGVTSRLGGDDIQIPLEDRCEGLNTASLAKGAITGITTVKVTDCKTTEGTYLLSEHSDLKTLEAKYEFVPENIPGKDAPKKRKGVYQGGWGTRVFGGEKKLPLPSDCTYVNSGRDENRTYIVCRSPDNMTFMREFSAWGVFEATYVFAKGSQEDWYQGGWASRLGGKPQVLPLPDECLEVKTAGRFGSIKYADCLIKGGDRMLIEYSDLGIIQAAYIFSKNAEEDWYQGGWASRLGFEPQFLKTPAECVSINNIGKIERKTKVIPIANTKYLTCLTTQGDYLQKEFTDFGILEARYRYK